MYKFSCGKILTSEAFGMMRSILYLNAHLRPGVSTAKWTDIGALKDIASGQPVKRDVIIRQDSGWGRFNSPRSVWIIKRDLDRTGFSAACPHLGCTIVATANGFASPCHGSSWSASGEKLGGTTPRNLDVLESRVDGDRLEIRYQDLNRAPRKRNRPS